METLRDFTNKPGVTFDPDKTYILYAEDLAQMKENFDLLNAMLSLSRQYTTSFLGAIKQGDVPIGETGVAPELEIRGSDLLDSLNVQRGGDVAIKPGENTTTGEKGFVTLGGAYGVRGYSVSQVMEGHMILPEGLANENDIIAMGAGLIMNWKALKDFQDFNLLSRAYSQNLIKYRSGSYYDLVPFCTAHASVTSAINRMEAVPFYCSATFEIDQIGIAVTAGVAASNCKIAIYNSDENGMPKDLLFGGSDISTAGTGFVFESTSISLTAGVLYWFVLKTSHGIGIRVNSLASAYNLGLSGSNATTYNTVLRKTETYSNSWDSVSTFTSAHLIANKPPNSMRFRVA